MDNTYSMIPELVPIAIETSISVCKYGVPLGGSFTWAIILFLTADARDYPWSHIQAAIIGFPLIIACDVALFVPSVIICYLKSKGELKD